MIGFDYCFSCLLVKNFKLNQVQFMFLRKFYFDLLQWLFCPLQPETSFLYSSSIIVIIFKSYLSRTSASFSNCFTFCVFGILNQDQLIYIWVTDLWGCWMKGSDWLKARYALFHSHLIKCFNHMYIMISKGYK